MNNKRSVLALISARGGGDAPPVVALAKGLKDRGHSVIVICDEETEQAVRDTNLKTLALPPELDETTYFDNWRNSITGDVDESTPNPLAIWGDLTLPYVKEKVEVLQPDLVISSLFCMGLADELAQAFNIPWCFVNPSFYFGDHQARDWAEDWYGSFVQWIARYCFYPLSQKANIVLHATDPDFDFQPSKLPANHHYTGFLLWEPTAGLLDYINTPGDPWALVTVSTVPQGDELSLARAAAWALSDQPVRTLLTLPYEDARNGIGELPTNAMVAGFVPHRLVMKQSSLVIAHAGHGIVSKALYHGVPMVLLPWNRDQPGVADRAVRLGVADVVLRDDVNEKSVRAAVSRVFRDTKYQELATKISKKIKANNAIDLACQLVEDFEI